MARICACDHEQSRHKLSKGGCRALDCYCAKFEGSGRTTDMADSAAADAFVETVLPVIEIQPEPVADDGVPDEPRILNAAERGPQPIPPGWSPDGASTLARLAKAERETGEVRELLDGVLRERDQARAALADVEGERKVGEQRLTAAEREREDLRRGRDEAVERALQLAAELVAAKTLADGFTEEFKRHEAERDGLVSASLNLQGERDEALARVRELEQDIDRDTGEHKLTAELADALTDKELAESRLAEANRNITALRESLNGSASTASVALRDLAEARGEVDRCMQQQGLTLRDLAEARTEVDNLRLSRDAAESQLAEARQVIEAMEEDVPANVIQVEYAPTGATLARYDRFFCQPITGCGKTAHQPDDDHECGPLIKATVTITH